MGEQHVSGRKLRASWKILRKVVGKVMKVGWKLEGLRKIDLNKFLVFPSVYDWLCTILSSKMNWISKCDNRGQFELYFLIFVIHILHYILVRVFRFSLHVSTFFLGPFSVCCF